MDSERDEAQRAVATGLAGRGLRPGDRVGLLAGNRLEVVDIVLGCLRAGFVPVPLNVQLTRPALAELLVDADPALVLTDTEHAGAVPRGLDLQVLGSTLPAGPAARVELAAWPQARPMHYTSGTTGRSKGVHSGLLRPHGGQALVSDERAAWGFDPDDVNLVCSPLYHSAPLRFALATLLYGGRVVVLPGFDAGAVLTAIAAEGVTTVFMAPTQLRRVLDHPALPSTRLHTLRWLAHAGAPCPETLKRRALEALPGDVVWEFYGSTEGQFTLISPEEWQARPGSVGRARPGRRLEILDDGGKALPAGEVGTVYCAVPDFARFTYWRDPVKTAAAWHGERFTAGDLGRLDRDGYLTLAGRRADVILSGGVNVYPAEVERVLAGHPDVAEGVVFGAPDAEWGERVCAAVVPRPGTSLDPTELRGWLRARLAGFQTPNQVLVVDELPRTATGKVLRAALVDSMR